MKQTDEAKIWTGPFFVALINNFFLFIVYYALVTILPVYIISELNGTEGQAGLTLTLFMMTAIIMRPFSGKIIEMFGKRKTLSFLSSSFVYHPFYIFSSIRSLYFLHCDYFMGFGLVLSRRC